MLDWRSAKVLPVVDGEYLCYVKIPKRTQGHHGSKSPTHFRYMTLEFAEGVFWINGGAPDGFVLYWTELHPPTGEITPLLRGRKTRWVEREIEKSTPDIPTRI